MPPSLYQKALKLRPDSPRLDQHGSPHAGRPSRQARDCFRTALGMDPDDATAMYNLGVVAPDLGDDRGAIDHYRQTLEPIPA